MAVLKDNLTNLFHDRYMLRSDEPDMNRVIRELHEVIADN